jgi:hypothetical protein
MWTGPRGMILTFYREKKNFSKPSPRVTYFLVLKQNCQTILLLYLA